MSLDAMGQLRISATDIRDYATKGQFEDFARTESRDTVSFSAREEDALALWDQLGELRLEGEVLKAQVSLEAVGESFVTRIPCRG